MNGRRGLWLFALASLLLHVAGVWALLPRGRTIDAEAQPAMIEVEMVDQAETVKGAPPAPSPAPPAAPAPPPPSLPPPPPPPLPLPETEAPAPQPPPPRDSAPDPPAPDPPPPDPPPPDPTPPAPPSPPAATRPPAPAFAVNLNGGDQDLDPLSVTGANVVPPRPDALAHNKPPGYPQDAVRRHAEGTVVLMVHVTADGTPAWVDVQTSSGDASLDRSASEAAALWRFQPARSGGKPVAFDYELAIHFSLDDRAGRPR